MATVNKLVTIINFRRIVSSLQQEQFMKLLSSICNECGFEFLRQILFNGLQCTENDMLESNLRIIMKLTTQILESQMNAISSVQHLVSNQHLVWNLKRDKNMTKKLQLSDLSEIDISNICQFLNFDDLVEFELTNRYIFIQAHKSISCISLMKKPNWFNNYLSFYKEKYQKTKNIDLLRFNHIKYLSLILDDNQRGSIMCTAKEIARRHNWSYSVTEFKDYCDYIGYCLNKLSKMSPIYLKMCLHFDWGIHSIRSSFPFSISWIKSLKHIHFYNMKWNYILRFIESQFHLSTTTELKSITFENILWENSYLNDPLSYFNKFLNLIFCGYSVEKPKKRRNINNNDNYNDDNKENDQLLQIEIGKSEYGKLHGYIDDDRNESNNLNGKLVKILHFSEYEGLWKCKRITPKIGYNGPINQYISVQTRNLKPLLILNNKDISNKKQISTGIEKLVFINMSLEKMIMDNNMTFIRKQMFKVFDNIDIVEKYLTPNLRYLVYHYNGNEKLFYHLIQSIITIKSCNLESLHLQTIKYLNINSIIFDILPFQSFDNLRELCIESSEQTSIFLERIAISIIGFQRLHLSIKSGFDGNNHQSKIHKKGVESLLKSIFSQFNQNSLQLLSFDMLFDFDIMDFQSTNFNSLDLKLNKLKRFYEILNQSISSQIINNYHFDTNKVPLKLRINLKYNIEIENNNNYFIHSNKKKEELINIITKKLNYFPMLFYELCKHLLSMRQNVMILFKCTFSHKSLYKNSNLFLMANDIKKNKLFNNVNHWEKNITNSINEAFEFGIIANTNNFIDPYRTKWLCSCCYCDDDEFFN